VFGVLRNLNIFSAAFCPSGPLFITEYISKAKTLAFHILAVGCSVGTGEISAVFFRDLRIFAVNGLSI